MAAITEAQLRALETTERVASCFSVVGTIFIFATFVSSPNFRRPINRLVFYASWGNTICNIATLMSRSPIGYGSDSHLCQFQAFLIQMFVPADAFWNLAMALNVYLTLFRKYNAQQLKALELRYHVLCYGIPFIMAFTLLFAGRGTSRGNTYGDAVLWCWISEPWDFLRVALCYAPAWICILASFTIYALAGRDIFLKRQALRFFNNNNEPASDPAATSTSDASELSNYKTTNVEITSTIVPLENIAQVLLPGMDVMGNQNPRGALGAGIRQESSMSGKVYEQYSVGISAAPMGSPRLGPQMGVVPSQPPGPAAQAQTRRNRAAMEANRAAWGYTKVALLFFVSLLVTWVPSSVNRVYALAHPGVVNVGLAYAAGIVLSLMGFWNSVIYIMTSRAACKEFFYGIVLRVRRERRVGDAKGPARRGSTLGHRPSLMKRGVSWGDDWERLAANPERGRGEGEGEV